MLGDSVLGERWSWLRMCFQVQLLDGIGLAGGTLELYSCAGYFALTVGDIQTTDPT